MKCIVHPVYEHIVGNCGTKISLQHVFEYIVILLFASPSLDISVGNLCDVCMSVVV